MPKLCKVCKIVLNSKNHYKGQDNLLCKKHKMDMQKEHNKAYSDRGYWKDYSQTPKGKKTRAEASKRAYVNHKEKWICRAKTHYAIKKGIIIKPDKCEVCEKKCSGHALQAHHEDYTKPLQVIFLCYSCHAEADKLLKSKL